MDPGGVPRLLGEVHRGVPGGSWGVPGGGLGGFWEGLKWDPLAGPWTVPGSLPQQGPNKAPTKPQQGPNKAPARPPPDPHGTPHHVTSHPFTSQSHHIKAPTRPPRDPASRHIAPHHITSPLFGPLGSPKGPPGPPEMDPGDPQIVTTSTRILHFFIHRATSNQGSTMG